MLAGIVLVIVVALFRLQPLLWDLGLQQPDWIPNSSPMAALCLCLAACFPRRWAIALPFIVLLGTDLVLNWHYNEVQRHLTPPGREFDFFSFELLGKTLAFAAIAAFGWQLRKQPSGKVLVPAAIGSSLFFYLVTNTASWLTDPNYAASFAAWGQAVTIGRPEIGIPTWMFFRNTAVSDVVFTLLFLACIRVRVKSPEGARQPAAAW